MKPLFSFPNPVDEVSARLVAGGVLILSVLGALTGNRVVLVVLAYGFVARVLTGPSLSPLGQLVTRVVRPRLPVAPRPVPGPPKRFAQGVGAAFSVTALLLRLADLRGASAAVLGVLIVFATLESVFRFCMGCTVFGWLMRAGVIPDSVCAECGDLRTRLSV
jgi:hypothetical protein